MGTSADRSSGAGGSWTPLKYAASSYVRGIGSVNSSERAARVLARHVPLLGGARGAASSARAGVAGIQRLGTFFTGLGSVGLSETLKSLGLESLVGQDRFVVLDALITMIAGDGDSLDSQAARDAACDVLDELFADANDWADLSAVTLAGESLVSMLERFLVLYVYNRVPVIAERLARLANPTEARQADQLMRKLIGDLVAIRLPRDPFMIDWAGGEGKAVAAETIELLYSALEDLEKDGGS